MSIEPLTEVRNPLPIKRLRLFRVKKDTPDAIEQVRFSIVTLMTNAEIGVTVTAGRAGINPKTINNLINLRHDPGLSTIENIARVFGLAAWQLLRPGGAEDLKAGAPIDQLLRNYLAASDRGREAIARLAQLEANANKQPPEGHSGEHDGNGLHPA